VNVDEQVMIVGERRIQMLAEADAKALPWSELGIDVVVESTASTPSAKRPRITSKRVRRV